MRTINFQRFILPGVIICVTALAVSVVSVFASTKTPLIIDEHTIVEDPHFNDESTLLFLTSFVLADLYVDHNGLDEAKQILEQHIEAYNTLERRLLYTYLLGRLEEGDTNSTTKFASKISLGEAETLIFDILLDLSHQPPQGKTLEQLNRLNMVTSESPCKVALKKGSHEIVKYLRFRALQKESPEKQRAQLVSIQQRIVYAKMLASKLVEIQREKKAFPASLEEIESLPNNFAQSYLYRGGPIKRPDIPIAMESIEKPTNGVIVIYADGHYELIRDSKAIKDNKLLLLDDAIIFQNRCSSNKTGK